MRKFTSSLNFSKSPGGKLVVSLRDGGKFLDLGAKGAESEESKAMFNRLKEKRNGSEEISFASGLRTESIPESVRVNPEDLYLVPFRLISATIVGADTWKATDFSQNNVLRDSMALLMGKPVYRDHMMYVDYWAGIVQQVSWTNEYIQDGIVVPAGIDGLLALDTTTDENNALAKGVAMGAVRSNSVTVEFEWEPSHEFPYDWQFYDMLGQVVDGRMVCRVVTRILDYHETSLVGLGADPFAKKIDSNTGNLIDIDLAGSDGLEIGVIGKTFSSDTDKQSFIRKVQEAGKFVISMGSEKASFGTSLGQKIESAIADVLSATTEADMSKDNILQQLADAAGISVQSVKLYIAGKNQCPKIEYLEAWAKVLRTTAKSLLAAAEADGCNYSVKSTDVIGESIVSEEKPESEAVLSTPYAGEMLSEFGKILKSLQAHMAEIKAQIDVIQSEKAKEEESGDCDDKKEEEYAKDGNPDPIGQAEANDQQSTEVSTEQGILPSSKTSGMNFEAQLKAKTEELALAQKAQSELKAEIERLKGELKLANGGFAELSKELDVMKAKIEAVKAEEHLSKIGKDVLAEAKQQAIRLYVASNKGQASEEFIALIKEAKSLTVVQEICKQHGKTLATQFAFSCASCNSTEFKFGSVIHQPEETEVTPKGLSDDEIRNKYS